MENEVNKATDVDKIDLAPVEVDPSLSDEAEFGKPENNSKSYQELLCRGWFLPPNTYDCGSFVVNGTAVVGKEPKKPYNRCKSTQKGANSYEISI